jgi:hypothetical protein
MKKNVYGWRNFLGLYPVGECLFANISSLYVLCIMYILRCISVCMFVGYFFCMKHCLFILCCSMDLD